MELEIFDKDGKKLRIPDVVARFLENEAQKVNYSIEDVVAGIDEDWVTKKHRLVVYDFEDRVINEYPITLH